MKDKLNTLFCKTLCSGLDPFCITVNNRVQGGINFDTQYELYDKLRSVLSDEVEIVFAIERDVQKRIHERAV